MHEAGAWDFGALTGGVTARSSGLVQSAVECAATGPAKVVQTTASAPAGPCTDVAVPSNRAATRAGCLRMRSTPGSTYAGCIPALMSCAPAAARRGFMAGLRRQVASRAAA